MIVTVVRSGLPGTAAADWAVAEATSLAWGVPGTQTCCGCGGTASCQGRRAEGQPRRSHG